MTEISQRFLSHHLDDPFGMKIVLLDFLLLDLEVAEESGEFVPLVN